MAPREIQINLLEQTLNEQAEAEGKLERLLEELLRLLKTRAALQQKVAALVARGQEVPNRRRGAGPR
jgi:hypothetical protein